jgi:hypothetical protein
MLYQQLIGTEVRVARKRSLELALDISRARRHIVDAANTVFLCTRFSTNASPSDSMP